MILYFKIKIGLSLPYLRSMYRRDAGFQPSAQPLCFCLFTFVFYIPEEAAVLTQQLSQHLVLMKTKKGVLSEHR